MQAGRRCLFGLSSVSSGSSANRTCLRRVPIASEGWLRLKGNGFIRKGSSNLAKSARQEPCPPQRGSFTPHEQMCSHLRNGEIVWYNSLRFYQQGGYSRWLMYAISVARA